MNLKRISKKELKEFVRIWIVLEIVIALWISTELGLSGLAWKFCEHFPQQRCDEIDWAYYGIEE